MARPLRVLIPGGNHHITARGNDKQALFVDDGDRRTFLRVLSDACSRHGAVVLAFCLMDNHVHLIVQDRRTKLSQILQQLNGSYAQRFNRRHGRTGHVFEGRFWNSPLQSDDYLVVATEYVHRNPLEAGMVVDLAAYPWSSYPVYLGDRRAMKMLDVGPVLSLYNGDRAQLRRATETNRRQPSEVVRSDDAHYLRPNAVDTSGGKADLDVDNLISIAATTFGVDAASITEAVRGKRNQARSATIHVARNVGGLAASEVAEVFGLGSGAAVAMACRRFGVDLANDALLAAKVHLIEQRLLDER